MACDHLGSMWFAEELGKPVSALWEGTDILLGHQATHADAIYLHEVHLKSSA